MTLGKVLCLSIGIPKQGSQLKAVFQLHFQQGEMGVGSKPFFQIGGLGGEYYCTHHKGNGGNGKHDEIAVTDR